MEGTTSCVCTFSVLFVRLPMIVSRHLLGISFSGEGPCIGTRLQVIHSRGKSPSAECGQSWPSGLKVLVELTGLWLVRPVHIQ